MPYERAIIEPYGGKGPAIGPLAVMAAMEDDLTSLRSMLSIGQDAGRPMMMSRIDSIRENDHGYVLVGPFIGAPYAVMLMEILIARGVRRIVFCGLCGAISPGAVVGDIIVPTAAFVDEGTSPHYAKNEDSSFPDPELSMEIVESLRASGAACHRGPVWTTDALYRETPSKVGHFRKQQAVAVEMEASALFTVGTFRKVAVAAVLVVSDELTDETWHPGFKNARLQEGRKNIREAIVRLCRNP